MELHTPFAIQVAWELGLVSLQEALTRFRRWPLPANLRLRSTHVPPAQLDVDALAGVLSAASCADRHADIETLVDALMTPFLRDALGRLTAALGGPPFRHGLLQLGLKYLPLRHDPPGTYDRFLEAFGDAACVTLNPYPVHVAHIPAGLCARRVGLDIHIQVPRDRMPRLVIHCDASATMSSAGAVLRHFLRLGQLCVSKSVVGALPCPPRTLAWALTPGTLPPDEAAHHRLLLAVRHLFARECPPSPLPPPVKRQRDLELHLSLLDALWRADIDRVALLLNDGAPLIPPYDVPKCVRAHVHSDRGPRILDVLHNAPHILERALDAGLWLPLMDAALWIVRRPAALASVLHHCDHDPTSLLEAVLVYCDSHVPQEAPLTVLPPLLDHAAPTADHLRMVRRRPDLFRVLYAAVGTPDALPACMDLVIIDLVPVLLDLAGRTDALRNALLRRPDLPEILRRSPMDLGPWLLDHIIVADLDEAFAALATGPPSPDVLALAIAVVSPKVVARCVSLGCVVTTAHLVPLIEASEDALHPMFSCVASLASDRVLRQAFATSVLPCCFAIALLDAGVTDARVMTHVQTAGLYVPDYVKVA